METVLVDPTALVGEGLYEAGLIEHTDDQWIRLCVAFLQSEVCNVACPEGLMRGRLAKCRSYSELAGLFRQGLRLKLVRVGRAAPPSVPDADAMSFLERLLRPVAEQLVAGDPPEYFDELVTEAGIVATTSGIFGGLAAQRHAPDNVLVLDAIRFVEQQLEARLESHPERAQLARASAILTELNDAALERSKPSVQRDSRAGSRGGHRCIRGDWCAPRKAPHPRQGIRGTGGSSLRHFDNARRKHLGQARRTRPTGCETAEARIAAKASVQP